LNSCNKTTDYAVKGTFVYQNNLYLLVEIRSGVYNFSIAPKQAYTIEELGNGEKKIAEKKYVPPMTSAVVIFYSFKCDTLNPGSKAAEGEGILSIGNYLNEKIAKRHYKFTFTFTTDDYLKADTCK
jgi:hypothetical protein